ncbi:MAG: glycosyltransferase family 2 protein [Alphaproteobacteria bacterium]|nr:glycosyltransferase family 2 protein [Alphaproteobacteria bacterium]
MKLSIVVPCYNVAPYLERGLTSLTNQTLTDIEIICIDDKSTDNTLEKLKEIAKCDLRIKVFENDENKGVGYTRNRGIDLAKGEFVGFMDPDDWVDTDFYAKLIDKAEKTQTPVVCGEVLEHPFGKKPIKLKRFVKRNYFSFQYHYSAVYHREFLNYFNICYPCLCIGEDTVFETMVKIRTPKPILHVRGVAYHYCRRPGSLGDDRWGKKQLDDYIVAINRVFDEFNNSDMDFPVQAYVAGALYYFNYFYEGVFTKLRGPELQRQLAEALIKLSKKQRATVLYVNDRRLFYALADENVDEVLGILKASVWEKREFFVFDRFKFMEIRKNKFRKIIFLFGVPVLRSAIKYE